MKKIIYIFLLLIATFISGCNEKNFLKEVPRDDIYAENLLSTYGGFQSMETTTKALMREEFCRVDNLGRYGSSTLPIVRHAMWGCGTDNSWSNNTHSSFRFMYYPSLIKQTDLDCMMLTFEWLYKIVSASNMVINRAEDATVNWEGGSAQANTTNKEATIARARLARAWAYRHLTYSFGAVPLSTAEINGLTYRTDWDRTPVAEIRKVMEADLQYAIDKLPLRTTNNTTLSGAVARHYLGELYLAMDNPTKAEEVLRPLVTGTEYSLMTTRFGSNASQPGCAFIDLFRSPLYSSGNKEVLLAFLNTAPENASTGSAPVYMKSSWKNYYSNDADIKKSNLSAPEVVNGTINNIKMMWLVNGGKGAARASVSLGSIRLYNYKNQGTVDDRVSNYSMVWKFYEKNAAGAIVEFLKSGKSIMDTTVSALMVDDSKTTIQNYKWPSTRKWDYVQTVAANGDADESYNDQVYLRLADTYLLYAEALYKLKNATAVDWINKVRQRSQAVALTANDLNTLGLDLILDERSRELLSEEERRHTLIRVSQENGGDERAVNNYFKRRVRTYNEICGRPARGMADATIPVLFPIPQIFIDSNTGRTITQNPGY
ncbi:MAG: RagB/SusD family nutrient uptake outer membrane protein [Prolixibacteraceae bacterium]